MLTYLGWINLFHIFFVVPFLVYFAYHKPDSSPLAFKALMIVGLVLILYHGWRYRSTGWIVNLFHIPLGLLFFILGYYGKALPEMAFNLFTLLAVLALITHTYLLYGRLIKFPTVT